MWINYVAGSVLAGVGYSPTWVVMKTVIWGYCIALNGHLVNTLNGKKTAFDKVVSDLAIGDVG